VEPLVEPPEVPAEAGDEVEPEEPDEEESEEPDEEEPEESEAPDDFAAGADEPADPEDSVFRLSLR
jgi:hypothetical protein